MNDVDPLCVVKINGRLIMVSSDPAFNEILIRCVFGIPQTDIILLKSLSEDIPCTKWIRWINFTPGSKWELIPTTLQQSSEQDSFESRAITRRRATSSANSGAPVEEITPGVATTSDDDEVRDFNQVGDYPDGNFTVKLDYSPDLSVISHVGWATRFDKTGQLGRRTWYKKCLGVLICPQLGCKFTARPPTKPKKSSGDQQNQTSQVCKIHGDELILQECHCRLVVSEEQDYTGKPYIMYKHEGNHEHRKPPRVNKRKVAKTNLDRADISTKKLRICSDDDDSAEFIYRKPSSEKKTAKVRSKN